VRRQGIGFTLLELLIVVLILAIAAAIVVPMAASGQDARCASAARMVVADLELAQSMALARQDLVALVFSDGLQSYKLVLAGAQDLDNYGLLTSLENGGRPGEGYEISIPMELQLHDVVISSVDFNGDRYVVFDTFGSPEFGGSIVLTAGDASLTVTVEPITGAVSVHQ